MTIRSSQLIPTSPTRCLDLVANALAEMRLALGASAKAWLPCGNAGIHRRLSRVVLERCVAVLGRTLIEPPGPHAVSPHRRQLRTVSAMFVWFRRLDVTSRERYVATWANPNG